LFCCPLHRKRSAITVVSYFISTMPPFLNLNVPGV
jgi:hypothetical protein